MAATHEHEGAVVGVDVGGTFTDAVVVWRGGIWTAKVPTTPDDQGEAVVAAVLHALGRAGATPADVERFAHGMTVGTNALLEGAGSPIALVTTAGFGDVVELRRQNRADLYRLGVHHPPPLVPAGRRFEVRERCGPEGIVDPLDEASLADAVDAVRASGLESAAVGLLFSFAHPAHERRVAEALRAAMPDLHVSVSSEVMPEIREYERIATTCVDAHLAPIVRRYLERLGSRAAVVGLPEPRIMQSNGGVIDVEAAARHPAWTVLSGPAAGVIGAAHLARAAGEPRVLTFDMGGTSCDVALIDGAPARTASNTINGHPIHLAMLDIHTVSAGGGSIAWADTGGALRVGPQSAGAVPGPACYGNGGTRPTVTDANVVLGRIDTDSPLAAGLRLDPEAARRSVVGLAAELGLDVERCAAGIVAVAVEEMARALRVVSVQRGIDPRDMALVAFGGAGPLHACDVADALEMRRVVVPTTAGVLAAAGLVVAGDRRDRVQTVLVTLGDPTGLDEARAAMVDALRAEVPGGDVTLTADCRYVGQTHTLNVDWDPDRPLDDLGQAFHGAHRARYGDTDAERTVQIVSIRAAVSRESDVPPLSTHVPDVPSFGPASFALDGATGWIGEGWQARSGPGGCVVLER